MSDVAAGGPSRSLSAPAGTVPCVTIPSDDPAFAEHVRRLTERHREADPQALQDRLRRLFPRAVVRARGLSGEPAAWYVYRDGAWRPPSDPWWQAPRVPRIVLGEDGWISDANLAARSLLGMDEARRLHYTDLVSPEARDAAAMLFQILVEGHPLSATLLVRPIGGHPIACEVRAERVADGIIAWLRLAEDVPAVLRPYPPALPPPVDTDPVEDVVFRRYVERELSSLVDPSPDGLAIRVRILFPHARVEALETGRWIARRDADGHPHDGTAWWRDPALPRVRYDERGLILEANHASTELLGDVLVGRHWHELVIPGSQAQVEQVLGMLRAMGEVVSRFRLPIADGRLVEFDSHTRLDGEVFETTMRPTELPEGP